MLDCASFFAGVGGIDLGFKQAGFRTIYANEYDEFAAETFEKNHGLEVDKKDIRLVSAEDIPDFDVLLAGFPCQAFSVAGYRQGFDDIKGRGGLFFELERIIGAKRPKVAFFENVKNLERHDNGNTFTVICNHLELVEYLGYSVKYKILNACEYGDVPQNRERIYIVAFRNKEDCDRFEFPESIPLRKTISDVIDFDTKMDDKYYYSEACLFYHSLRASIKRHDTTYQWRRKYVRENKSNLVPTLTANMGTGGHNVPLILTRQGDIRKLTPEECFYVQGFPKDFQLPDQSNTRLYKQAGNSVVVPVIHRIAEEIKDAIMKEQNVL
jgi:DNA (cytosine-5)-methyltransferase 1